MQQECNKTEMGNDGLCASKNCKSSAGYAAVTCTCVYNMCLQGCRLPAGSHEHRRGVVHMYVAAWRPRAGSFGGRLAYTARKRGEPEKKKKVKSPVAGWDKDSGGVNMTRLVNLCF